MRKSKVNFKMLLLASGVLLNGCVGENSQSQTVPLTNPISQNDIESSVKLKDSSIVDCPIDALFGMYSCLPKAIGNAVLNVAIAELNRDTNLHDTLNNWKQQLGLYELIGEWPLDDQSPFIEVNKKLDNILAATAEIKARLDAFYGLYNSNTFKDAALRLQTQQHIPDQLLNKIDDLFTNLPATPNTGSSMRIEPDFDKLMTHLYSNYKNNDNLTAKLKLIFTSEAMSSLEHAANYLSSSSDSIVGNTSRMSDSELAHYFELYHNMMVDPEYVNKGLNGILIKHNYDSAINADTLLNIAALQNIYNVQAMAIYMYYIKDIKEVILPSYISSHYDNNGQTKPEDAFRTAMAKLNLVYFGTSTNEGKIGNLLNTAKDATNFFKLPIVLNLPSECLQPDEVATQFTTEQLEKSQVFWSGYNGDGGKLSTMCKRSDSDGIGHPGPYKSADNKFYVQTYPLFTNTNNIQHYSNYCTRFFHPENSDYLFCHNSEESGIVPYVTNIEGMNYSLPLIDPDPNDPIASYVLNNHEGELPFWTSLWFGIEPPLQLHIDAKDNGTSFSFDSTTARLTFDSMQTMFRLFYPNIVRSQPQPSNGKLHDNRWLETELPHYEIGKNGIRRQWVLPTEMPFILYFRDVSGSMQTCPITLSALQNHPMVMNINKYRCGRHGEFSISLDSMTPDTINIKYW